MPIGIGFVIPAVYLIDESRPRVFSFAGISTAIVSETVNTIAISLLATVLTLGAGVVVAYTMRIDGGAVPAALSRLASLGYAVPGTVLAIGLLPIVSGVETAVDAGTRRVLGRLVGAVPAWAPAPPSSMPTSCGFSRSRPGASKPASAGSRRRSTMRRGRWERRWPARLRRVHLPLLRPALATAALLVFVDCMKELPATLLLRPLGFETLATHLYGEAVRGTYEEAAIAALMIVAAGLVPVLLLARISRSDTFGGALGR